MFKIYKRTIRIGSPEHMRRSETRIEEKSGSASKILAIPAAIAGVVVGTLVFSAFFVLALIPLSLLGFKVWRRMNDIRKQADQEIIDAEYTVVSDSDKKNRRN